MKKKLTVLLVLVAMVSALFAMTTFGAYAAPDYTGATITINNTTEGKISLTKGSSLTLSYTIKDASGNAITSYVDGNFVYTIPVTVTVNDNGTEKNIDEVKNLGIGDYTITVALKDNAAIKSTATLSIVKAKGNYATYIMLGVAALLLVGIFVYSSYSNKKRQKQAQEVAGKLEIGDKVKTIGGICGYVVEINDDENTFVLESGTDKNKTYTKFDKAAIYQTAKPGEATADEKANEASKEKAAKKKATKEAKEEDAFDQKDDKDDENK